MDSKKVIEKLKSIFTEIKNAIDNSSENLNGNSNFI